MKDNDYILKNKFDFVYTIFIFLYKNVDQLNKIREKLNTNYGSIYLYSVFNKKKYIIIKTIDLDRQDYCQ